MTGNTGLLLGACDAFGAESTPTLAGGVFGPQHIGKIHWYCKRPPAGRYRMVCTGGDYGHRLQNDGGLIGATHCDGGHRGPPVKLCNLHVREFSVGPPPPWFTKDLKTPLGQVGGTRASEMCPACMWPPEARHLQAVADDLQQQMSVVRAGGTAPIPGVALMSELARLQSRFIELERRQDVVRARLDELFASGRIHKCPLILREVS
jgi:hypothetical protein